ncbi:hypothetical protein ABT294_44170 [Nonomuraea sp. NPDC000554]|uniref:hypothetical protein n=1 Tax=Nonomuraea sp. NPDC000554 TaxID=3154259 RepID=UPI0033277E0A
MITRLLAGAALGLTVLSGTAAADPITGKPLLTDNALYKAGKLPKVACAAKKGKGRAATEKYIGIVHACLKKVWGVKDMRLALHYSPIQKHLPTMTVYGFEGISVALGDDWIKAGDDHRVFHEMASVYGHYILIRAGISTAHEKLDFGGDLKVHEQHERRYTYQQDCLAGAAAWALGRPARNPALKGNELYWFEQGYKAGGPQACNTWTASDAKVA